MSQGSILGPLLFLIYVNDIIESIESDFYLFADDTSVTPPIKDPKLTFDMLRRDLERLNTWSKKWLMQFNLNKTKYLIFSKKLPKLTYPAIYLGGQKLKQVTEHCQLGLLFHESFNWDARIKQNTRRNIYLQYISSILEYGYLLYDNCTIVMNDLLEKTQRQAISIVTSGYRHFSHEELQNKTVLACWLPDDILQN